MGLNSKSIISPRKLRSDLYSYPNNTDMPPLVVSVLAALIERHMGMARTERIARDHRWVPFSRDPRTTHVLLFDAHEAPDLTIQSFLERIFRYTKAAPSVYVVAYVYIDRFCQNYPTFRISPRNVHRLLITTIMVASKFVEDMNYRNSHYARVGGVTTKEMNKMEMEFLFMMGFKMHVNSTVFESYCRHLEREVSIGGGYHIEKALRCAQEIKLRQSIHKRCGQSARITL